jgi:threonine synthase
VSEAEIVQGVKEASSTEGIFMAPEGGACVAAARKLRAAGHLGPDHAVVLFNTGTGYKYVENFLDAGWQIGAAPAQGER